MKKIFFLRLTGILITCQVITDGLQSVTVFPFLHYGMFSESFNRKEIEVFEITVNGRVLTANNYGILIWDLIHSPLSSFKKQISTNDFDEDKKALETKMKMVGLQKAFAVIAPNLSNSPRLRDTFPSWYKNYLTKLLHNKVLTLQVNILSYTYKNGNYILLNKAKWIEV
ncbi:MAG: hypothetical protein M3O67_03250 [Bacteroidota bacterium]|nr:hypothetical protein [Bacteroidota bacterium]